MNTRTDCQDRLDSTPARCHFQATLRRKDIRAQDDALVDFSSGQNLLQDRPIAVDYMQLLQTPLGISHSPLLVPHMPQSYGSVSQRHLPQLPPRKTH